MPTRCPIIVQLLLAAIVTVLGSDRVAAADLAVDTALVVSIDVSGSVSEERYQLQMQGVAQALEDPAVVDAITSGPHSAILFSMITWADKPAQVIGWSRISSRDDASRVAARVRALPHSSGEFTCFGRMFDLVAEEVIPTAPIPATRMIVDVSGDGIDNCVDAERLRNLRDGVLKKGATINGLPILVPGENDFVGSSAFRAPGYGLRELSRNPDHEVTTLDRWYATNVVGGANSFVLPAKGYKDFSNAIKRKFVIEISSAKSLQFLARN